VAAVPPAALAAQTADAAFAESGLRGSDAGMTVAQFTRWFALQSGGSGSGDRSTGAATGV
jgi:hypothetical protein